MPYRAAKISFDGSHYIATPKENFPQGHKRRRAARPLSVEEVEKKEQFEAAYKESQKLPRKERKAYMRKAMEETIPDKEQRKEYVERNNERKTTNKIRRKVRLSKKVNLQRIGISFARLRSRTRCIPKRVFVSRSVTHSNTSSPAKAGSMSAYGSAAVKQADCISTVSSTSRRAEWSERSSKQRITVPKTTGCRRRTKIPTFSNGTEETIFKRSARRWKYSIRSAI